MSVTLPTGLGALPLPGPGAPLPPRSRPACIRSCPSAWSCVSAHTPGSPLCLRSRGLVPGTSRAVRTVLRVWVPGVTGKRLCFPSRHSASSPSRVVARLTSNDAGSPWKLSSAAPTAAPAQAHRPAPNVSVTSAESWGGSARARLTAPRVCSHSLPGWLSPRASLRLPPTQWSPWGVGGQGAAAQPRPLCR